MTNLTFLLFRAFFITIMTIGMMASLTDFRFGRKKLLGILAVYSVWAVASSAVLLRLGGELLLLRLFFFTISIPAILLTYWTANDTPTQAVFNYITQILLSLLMASMVRLLTDTLCFPDFINILLMGVFYVTIIYLEWRFVRRPFRMLVKMIPSRWGILTFIPCVFTAYLIFLATWPNNYIYNTAQRVYLYAAIVPLVIVYVVMFKSLIAQYHIQMERQSATLLTVQIAALKEKLQKVKEVEDRIRIQRHDLRHQLQTVTELVARGDREAALDFLDAAQQRLDDHKSVRWCRPPVLDAVCASYIDQARRQGIRVDAKISLPDTLPVDEGELAIVLANALENAIHANLELPQCRRELRCKLLGIPGIMLELSNPCTGDITFDTDGLPMARRDGHGLGCQSISAFCRKHGAVCQFTLTDGWFRLRLIL